MSIENSCNKIVATLGHIRRYNELVKASSFTGDTIREMKDNCKDLTDDAKGELDNIKAELDNW